MNLPTSVIMFDRSIKLRNSDSLMESSRFVVGAQSSEERKHSRSTLGASSFDQYVDRLDNLLSNVIAQGLSNSHLERITCALDGEPGRELRQHYTLAELRESGTFLTGSKLANTLVSKAASNFTTDAVFCDPACGAGDLLVAVARHLPIKQDLSSTLIDWGKRLMGFDLQPLLIRATKTRLALLALSRSVPFNVQQSPDLNAAFPLIKTGDGTAAWGLSDSSVFVFINPPFTRVIAPEDCPWSSGLTSQAALFIDSCLAQKTKQCSIHAILPDVLRTGSRYKKWRQLVCEQASIDAVTPIGLFDKWTDIDVFTVKLNLSRLVSKSPEWPKTSPEVTTTISSKFYVRVGSIVAYRHIHQGPWFPYVHARTLPAWKHLKDFPERIRNRNTTFKPPFVLIRRTSRPGDQNRAIGTLVTGQRHIAVENHLLVVLPKDGTVRSCKELLGVLRHPQTTAWLNKRIRCRHLTVPAVCELPWIFPQKS